MRGLIVRKYVDNLMFYSKESNWTFRLQNNTLYKFQSIQYSTKFRHKHGVKVSIHTSLVPKKLQTNFNRSFNKAGIKHFCKTSLQDF